MKHGKYSRTKEVKPYKLTITTIRIDGELIDEHYFDNEEHANEFLNFCKKCEPKPNQYYFRTEYKIEYIGTEKYIKG